MKPRVVRSYRLPTNWDSVRGFPEDPYWGFADIMTLERGPSHYNEKDAIALIREIESVLSFKVW